MVLVYISSCDYHVIRLQEGSCILTGISYNGVDKSGSVDWYGLSNIHLLKAETSITLQVNCVAAFIAMYTYFHYLLQGIVESFNINTNKWIAL